MTGIPKPQPGEVLWLLLFGPMHAEFIYTGKDISSICIESWAGMCGTVKFEYKIQFSYDLPDGRVAYVAVPMNQRTPTLHDLKDMVAGIVATRPINPTRV